MHDVAPVRRGHGSLIGRNYELQSVHDAARHHADLDLDRSRGRILRPAPRRNTRRASIAPMRGAPGFTLELLDTDSILPSVYLMPTAFRAGGAH